MAKLTEKQIQEVLAGLSVEQLTAARAAKLTAELQPLIDEWEKVDGEQDDRIAKSLEINPEWKPANLGDKIVAWLTTDNEPKTKEEILKQFPGKNIGLALSKIIKKGRVELKENKYSLAAK